MLIVVFQWSPSSPLSFKLKSSSAALSSCCFEAEVGWFCCLFINSLQNRKSSIISSSSSAGGADSVSELSPPPWNELRRVSETHLYRSFISCTHLAFHGRMNGAVIFRGSLRAADARLNKTMVSFYKRLHDKSQQQNTLESASPSSWLGQERTVGRPLWGGRPGRWSPDAVNKRWVAPVLIERPKRPDNHKGD